MKRGPKESNKSGANRKANGDELVKSTYLINRNMKKHLAVAAIVNGVDQADIVREAIGRYLKSMEKDPARPPVLPEYDLQLEQIS